MNEMINISKYVFIVKHNQNKYNFKSNEYRNVLHTSHSKICFKNVS